MIFFLSQNKKILLVALSILIVTASVVLLVFGGDGSALKADSVSGGEGGNGTSSGEEAKPREREGDIEKVKSLNEILDLR